MPTDDGRRAHADTVELVRSVLDERGVETSASTIRNVLLAQGYAITWDAIDGALAVIGETASIAEPSFPTREEIDVALRSHRPDGPLLRALDQIPFPDGGYRRNPFHRKDR